MDIMTAEIIMICKGKHNFDKNLSHKEVIRAYLSDESQCPKEFCTNDIVNNVIYQAALDYIDNQKRPSAFIRRVKEVYDIYNNPALKNNANLPQYDWYDAICGAFSTERVRKGDEFVNGFTEENTKFFHQSTTPSSLLCSSNTETFFSKRFKETNNYKEIISLVSELVKKHEKRDGIWIKAETALLTALSFHFWCFGTTEEKADVLNILNKHLIELEKSNREKQNSKADEIFVWYRDTYPNDEATIAYNEFLAFDPETQIAIVEGCQELLRLDILETQNEIDAEHQKLRAAQPTTPTLPNCEE